MELIVQPDAHDVVRSIVKMGRPPRMRLQVHAIGGELLDPLLAQRAHLVMIIALARNGHGIFTTCFARLPVA